MGIRTSNGIKPAVELTAADLELAETRHKLQLVCPHTYGTQMRGHSEFCPYCGWDKSKCQHKLSLSRGDKYCSDCGEKL